MSFKMNIHFQTILRVRIRMHHHAFSALYFITRIKRFIIGLLKSMLSVTGTGNGSAVI